MQHEGGGGLLSEEAVIVGKIKITPDVRTNRIHVVTRPINMPFIRQLIHEFDANVEFAKPVTRYLRYISAGDVLPVLVQALTEPGTEQGAGAGGQGGLPGVGPSPGQGQGQQRQGGAGTSPLTNNYSGGQGGTDQRLGLHRTHLVPGLCHHRVPRRAPLTRRQRNGCHPATRTDAASSRPPREGLALSFTETAPHSLPTEGTCFSGPAQEPGCLWWCGWHPAAIFFDRPQEG